MATLTNLASISAGDEFTCAVRTDASAVCWGEDSDGQLGDDATRTEKPVPGSSVSLADVASISAGDSHACAVTIDAALYCWGDNDDGQLGNGAGLPTDATADDKLMPVPVGLPAGARALDVAAGLRHTCAHLVIPGSSPLHPAYCWGGDPAGQLGDGTAGGGDISTPAPVVQLDGVDSVSTGRDHSCVRTRSSVVRCWGDNEDGQLGTGTGPDSGKPVTVSSAGKPRA